MKNRNLRIVAIINFLTDFRPYAPIAILYFSHITGSYAKGMTVFSIVMIASMLFELPTGIISDRIGRKGTLLVGAVFGTISVAVYAAASRFTLLLVGGALEGISRAFYSGNNNALVYDSLKSVNREKEFHSVLGRLGSLFQIALAVSALLGGFLATRSFRLTFIVSAFAQGAIIGVGLFLVEPQSAARRKTGSYISHLRTATRKFFSDATLRNVSFANALSNAVGEACYQFQSTFIRMLWPVWAIGIGKALSNVGAALSFWFAGRVIDRFGEIRSLIFARVVGRITTVLALTIRSVISPVLISSSSLLFGVSVVSKESFAQRRFSDDERATMGSISEFLSSALFGLASPLLGLLADLRGPVEALLYAQLVMIVSVGILWRYRTRKQSDQRESGSIS
jgi:MFS family permease